MIWEEPPRKVPHAKAGVFFNECELHCSTTYRSVYNTMHMDNQQPPAPIYAPDLNQQPIPPKQPFIKKYGLALLVASVVLMFALTASILVLLRGNETSNNQNNTEQSTKFKNWLAPQKEIKVGQYRYVSPCQVFTLDDAKNFNGLAEDTFVSEDYADTDFAGDATNKSLQTSCRYNIKNDTYRSITIDAEQYIDINDAKKLSRTVLERPEELQQSVDALASVSQGNESAKKLHQRLKESASKYKEYYNFEFDPQKLSQISVDGIVLPGNGKKFFVFKDNIAYTVTLETEDVNKDIDSAAFEDYAQAIEIIEKNASNTSLDQSPVATILGDSDKVASTKIMEPCSILTGSIYQQLAGGPHVGIVERITVTKDAEKISSRTDANLVANFCERSRRVQEGGQNITTRIGLTLRYARTEEAALNWLKGGEGTTPLQTTADQSYILNPRFASEPPVFYFRVGKYIGNVSFEETRSTTLSAPIATTDVSNERYVQAINLLVAELKKNL